MPASSNATAHAVRYRPDIDGLRAVAVLAVITFHAIPTWLPGGFAGVDVFFVISGFLISQQLFEACDRKEFSIWAFYVRRIRRIVPALLVVLVACAGVGWLVLTPDEYANLQSHLAASAFFSNNFLLWFESGYFDSPSKAKPLLHLWSLGVEEQFYIVWPWLIFWCWRRGLNRTTVIGIVTVLSFATSAALVSNGNAAAAFYLPHSRLWQIAAGAWLASATMNAAGPPGTALARRLFLSPTARDIAWSATVISGAGLILIATSFVSLGQAGQESWWTAGSIDRLTWIVRYIQLHLGVAGNAPVYPGWAALLPTSGAALILAAGPAAWLNRVLLSRRGLVFIGLISYPLYLWHWPMLSYLTITEQGSASRFANFTAIAIAFVLATLSYLFIEKPIRAWVQPAAPRRAGIVAGGLAVVGVAALVALSTGSFLPRARVAVTADQKVTVFFGEPACQKNFPVRAGYCQQFLPDPAPIKTALWGDSHAAHLFPGLGARLAERGENLVHFGSHGCPPLLNVDVVRQTTDTSCADVNRADFAAITGSADVTEVVLAFRGGIYDIGDVEGATPTRIGSTPTDGPALAEALRATVAALQERQKHVTLVLPMPRMSFEIGECLGRPWSLVPRPRREPCAVERAGVLSQQASFRRGVSELAQRLDVTVVDPVPALCDDQLCYAVRDGQPLYSDNNHLGIAGSNRVASVFALTAR